MTLGSVGYFIYLVHFFIAKTPLQKHGKPYKTA